MAIADLVRPELQQVTLDCCGMKCPAPILKIAMTAKSLGDTGSVLHVVSDDPDFGKDVKAWCRTYKATLIRLHDEADGKTTAVIGLGGVTEASDTETTDWCLPPQSHVAVREDAAESVPASRGAPPAAAHARLGDLQRVDCRGRLNPLEMVARAASRLDGRAGVLEVLSDAAGFPVQIQAWCRSAHADLEELTEGADGHRAVLKLPQVGESESSVESSAPPLEADTTVFQGAADSLERLDAQPPPGRPTLRHELDMTGLRAPEPVLRMATYLTGNPGSRIRVRADDATFLVDAMAWASATRAQVTMAHQSPEGVVLDVSLHGHESTAAVRARPSQPVGALVAATLEAAEVVKAPSSELSVPSGAQLGEFVGPTVVSREDRVTALVMHNDFENLLCAMMFATTAAAQGKEVAVFFSLWGVNMLRAERPRKEAVREPRNLLQLMMQWMMPRGPSRQPLSQMHMGGVGKGMMQLFMKKKNVMSLEQLIDSAVQGQVRFIVCSMSMEIMGIRRCDIMNLPNIEFAGMSTFVELSSQSGASLVF